MRPQPVKEWQKPARRAARGYGFFLLCRQCVRARRESAEDGEADAALVTIDIEGILRIWCAKGHLVSEFELSARDFAALNLRPCDCTLNGHTDGDPA